MSRRQKAPLRELTSEERSELERLSRASSAPAAWVIRAKLVLAVARGANYTEAARSVGRKSGDAVSQLVERFNREGLAAIEPRHGGGPAVRYGPNERERVLAEVRRAPDRERDGTATWSLSTLQRALRQAEDGLPQISTYTLHETLRDAGWSWQESRSWCETG
jgi:transposase